MPSVSEPLVSDPLVSVIMPVYNVEKYVAKSIISVIKQTFIDFELIIVIDGSTDFSEQICRMFFDSRIRIVVQKNRGLAGARNTGIRESKGRYLAFIDSDDLWHPDKLSEHVTHLNNAPDVGISYCMSELIDDNDTSLGVIQSPKLYQISFEDVLCRNPIGNGSAPVIKRAVFEHIEFERYHKGVKEPCYFDESFRQSEDIECWLRMICSSTYKFEGIPKVLTLYRANSGGLSANLKQQYKSWNRVINKISKIAPKRMFAWESKARAYQLRYLARRAINNNNPSSARKLMTDSLQSDFSILVEEPVKSISTVIYVIVINLLPTSMTQYLYDLRKRMISPSSIKSSVT